MKKMYLKTVAIILSVIFVLTAMPVTAIAQDMTDTQAATQSNEISTVPNTNIPEIMFDSIQPKEDYVEQNETIREMTSRREENVKHFIMPDGTVQAIIYSSAVHRKDSNGKWQDIDNTLTLSTVKNNSMYVTDDLRVSFSKTYKPNSTLWNLNENGYSISMAFVDDTISEITPITPELSTNSTVDSESEAVTSVNNATPRNEKILWDTIEEAKLVNNDSFVTYSNVRSNTDIEYVLSGNDVKENIIVKAPESSYVYKFEITLSGLYAILNENGSISIIDAESNEEKYSIPAPYMYDAEHNFSYDVSYTLVSSGEDKYILTVTADKDWINSDDRAFPVVIDPTIQNSGSADTYVDSQNVGENYGNSTTLWLSSTRTIFIKMYNYELPTYADLVSVNLNMSYYYYSNVTSGYISAGAYQVTTAWGENTLTWYWANQEPNLSMSTTLLSAAVLSGSEGAYSTSPKWISFDITDAAESWYGYFTLPENNHYGIAIKYMMGSNASVILNSYESSASYRPYFTITYTEPRIANGVYKIKNVANGLYLDVTDGNTASGTTIQQWSGTATDNNRNQLFKLTYLDTFDNMHHYSIRPMTNSGQGITSSLSGNSVPLVTEGISLTEAIPDIAFRQSWIISVSGNYYTIRNGIDDIGNYITAPSNSTNGSAVVTNPTATNSYGKWILEPYTGEAIDGTFLNAFSATLSVGNSYYCSAGMYSSTIGRNGPVTFSVKSVDYNTTDKATINSETGLLTILKPGQFKIGITYQNAPWIWYYIITVDIPYSVYVDFFYDNGFITRNKIGTEDDVTTKARISSNILNVYFPKVAAAFEEIHGIHLISNQTVAVNYTSAADNCPSTGINNPCTCISDDECLLEYWHSPYTNNTTNGFEYDTHCKSMIRHRNDLIVGIPSNTIRIGYTGHYSCMCDSNGHNYATAGLSDYDYPIISMRDGQNSDNLQRCVLVLAHELSHTYGIIGHHAASDDITCIMENDPQRYAPVDINDPSTYWCQNCINTIAANKNKY